MVSLSYTTHPFDGVTLVTARLEGGEKTQRIRLHNGLDGPVWPPRRYGRPSPEWNGSELELTVPARATVPVGYASPAEPRDPAIEIVDRTVHIEDVGENAMTPERAFERLGDPSPPRDAIPVPGGVNGSTPNRASTGMSLRSENPSQVESIAAGAPSRSVDPDTTAMTTGESGEERIPPVIDAWFESIERHIVRAERLSTATTLAEMTTAVEEAGNLAAIAELVESLDRDGEILRRIAERADALAERETGIDVPITTLERLA